ncbi:brain and acute leukemia cytoplasmic protein isoform X4 [Heterocephalus glaber]|uniref:Brain and acute leukemia cytoplasmic protein isoform X4 n=1 Tax=Heterocephalus glaber TaxID=10181 RepID=A0AAX6TEC5_HETGA|nr:brain and acute leukemia cytoplasmic protein isoform X4 [Heterocephalus glaber]
MGSAPSRVGRAPSSGRDDGETAVLRGQSEVARGWPGHCAPHGALEDGPSPSGVPRATVTSGISNLEKKMNCGIQSLSSGPLAQKQNGLWGTQSYAWAVLLLLPWVLPDRSKRSSHPRRRGLQPLPPSYSILLLPPPRKATTHSVYSLPSSVSRQRSRPCPCVLWA